MVLTNNVQEGLEYEILFVLLGMRRFYFRLTVVRISANTWHDQQV